MLLNIFPLLIWFLFAYADKKHATFEESVAYLECTGYCHRVFYRRCRIPPDICGDCMESYYLDGSICRREDPEKTFVPGLNEISSAIDGYQDERPTGPGSFLREDYVASKNDTVLSSFHDSKSSLDHYWDIMLIAVLSSVSLILIVAIVSTLICLCRTQRDQDRDVPYQTFYGVEKGPNTMIGDRKLAYSAQMYHYQYQKQQMLANEKSNGFDQKNLSGNSTDEEVLDDDEGMVYEYKGPAAEGELEVTNPYFCESPTNPNRYDANANHKNVVHH